MKFVYITITFIFAIFSNASAIQNGEMVNGKLREIRNYCDFKKINNAYQCLESIGEEQAKKYKNLVRYNDKEELILKLDNGKEKVLINEIVENKKNYYFYEFISEINYYVVTGLHGSGIKVLFINKENGEEFWIEICDFWNEQVMPYFSSSLQRFVCFGDPEYSYGNKFYIYKINKEDIKEEYVGDRGFWPSGMKWVGDSDFSVNYSYIDNKEGRKIGRLFMKLENGVWKSKISGFPPPRE